MQFLPTVNVSKPQQLRGLQPGQWIDYQGARGRYCGRHGGVVWIAWGGTARKRWKLFADAFKAQRDRKPFRPNWDRIDDGGIHRIC